MRVSATGSGSSPKTDGKALSRAVIDRDRPTNRPTELPAEYEKTGPEAGPEMPPNALLPWATKARAVPRYPVSLHATAQCEPFPMPFDIIIIIMVGTIPRRYLSDFLPVFVRVCVCSVTTLLQRSCVRV